MLDENIFFVFFAEQFFFFCVIMTIKKCCFKHACESCWCSLDYVDLFIYIYSFIIPGILSWCGARN